MECIRLLYNTLKWGKTYSGATFITINRENYLDYIVDG